jgi:hypothetical protein
VLVAEVVAVLFNSWVLAVVVVRLFMLMMLP